MKKSAVFILVLMLFSCLPLVVAVEFDMKDNYAQGETIIAKISGNFLTSVTRDNIFFYRGHVRIAMEYDITKIGEDYYLYALLTGKSPANYSISVEDVKYMKGREVMEDNIVRNFSITNDTAPFSLNPGFVVSSEDFFVEVQNLRDKKITVNVKTETNNSGGREILILPDESREYSLSLISGEIEKIKFKLGAGEPAFQKIKLSAEGEEPIVQGKTCFFWENCTQTSSGGSLGLTYELPVYISSGAEGAKKKLFRFEPSELISSFPLNTISKRTFYLYNTGGKEMKNISLSLSDSLTPFANLSVKKIEKLANDSNVPVELSFSSVTETEIEGSIKAETGNTTADSFISLKFVKNYIPSNDSESTSTKTCAELQGKICSQEEQCDSESVYAKDNNCCLGTCQKITKSSTGKIIAVALIIMIILVLLWFYYAKYKRSKRVVDFMKLAKKQKLRF